MLLNALSFAACVFVFLVFNFSLCFWLLLQHAKILEALVETNRPALCLLANFFCLTFSPFLRFLQAVSSWSVTVS